MSDENKNKFYLKGKFYETEEQFCKAVVCYEKNNISTEDLKIELYYFVHSLILNHETKFWNINGRKLNKYIQDCFLKFFETCKDEVE